MKVRLCVSCKGRRNQATWPQSRVILDTLDRTGQEYIMSWAQVSFYWTIAPWLPALDCLVPFNPVPVGIRLKLKTETGALDLSRDVKMFTTRRENIFSQLYQVGVT